MRLQGKGASRSNGKVETRIRDRARDVFLPDCHSQGRQERRWVCLIRPRPSLATRPSRSGRGLASAQVDMPSVAFLNG